MSARRWTSRIRAGSTSEHAAERPAGAGGHELVAARERERSRAPRTGAFGRFRWAIAGLFVVALVALGAAVVLSSSGNRATGGGDWSDFSPSDTGLSGAQEIADYVAPYYRATPSNQLAVVTAVNLNNANNPLQVAVPGSGSQGGLVPLPASSTIVYNMCGVGNSNCSIGTGQPSSSRLLLLRREALELALYTFKYLDGIDSVVAILPPGRTVQGCTGICPKPQTTTSTKPVDVALAFSRNELKPWLSHPLRQTLPEALPPSVSQMQNAPEAELISIITAHGLFGEKTEQGQDGSTVIVLSPMPPQ
ncbi:MAG TPA: hypothetical protein VGH24_06665 [Solirubrobacteraceae bacterium]|jgi:hypothetical protein